MDVHVVKSLAEPVAARWEQALARKPAGERLSVASPLSSTPLPLYRLLLERATPTWGWERTVFVLMDEQLEGTAPPFRYVDPNDPASYERFARERLLDPLREKTGIEVPLAKPQLKAIEEFAPPIDLLILALGVRGNYANVMPGTPLCTSWHTTRLIAEFRRAHTQAGSGSYEGAAFREYGMSLGPQQVIAAGEVIVIVAGAKKRELAQRLLSYDRFDPKFPLSIIHHEEVAPRTTLFVTHDVGVV